METIENIVTHTTPPTSPHFLPPTKQGGEVGWKGGGKECQQPQLKRKKESVKEKRKDVTRVV